MCRVIKSGVSTNSSVFIIYLVNDFQVRRYMHLWSVVYKLDTRQQIYALMECGLQT